MSLYCYSEADYHAMGARNLLAGRPVEGSKNLRLHLIGKTEDSKNIYGLRLHSSNIVIYRPDAVLWTCSGWDSVITKRHLNNHIPYYEVFSWHGVLSAMVRDGRFASAYPIDTQKYYHSGPGNALYEVNGWSGKTAKELRPITLITKSRGIPKTRDVILNPKAGDIIELDGKAYIWMKTDQFSYSVRESILGSGDARRELLLMRFHGITGVGCAPWAERQFGYLEWDKAVTDYNPNSNLWFAVASELKDRGAKPITVFTGDRFTGKTITLGESNE